MAKKTKTPKPSKAKPTRAGGAEAAIEVSGRHATLLIEVQPTPRVILAGGEGYQGGQTAGAAEDALAKLKNVGGAVAEVCQAIYDEVHDALEEAAPNELTLEFGLKLSGETGMPLLTKVSAEGSLVVTAKWVLKK